MRRIVSSLIVAMLFPSLFVFAFTVQTTLSILYSPDQSGTIYIYINPNGSITPSNVNITTSDNITYTFTGNNYLPIVVNRSNIIINGMGHTLQAPGENGFSLSGMRNVTIKNTTITNSYEGIFLGSSSGNILSGNNVTANSYGIWLISSSDNNILSGNTVTANKYDGIGLISSSGDNLSSNNAANSWYGIYLGSSDNSTLSGNTLTANSMAGIWIYNSSSNVLSSNNVTANRDYGILLSYSSDNNTLSGNNVTANSGDGIFLTSSSSSARAYDNTLAGNNIAANSGYGVDLTYASGDVLSGNNVIGNSFGVWLYSSFGNTFYDNNFINNTHQVQSDGSPNTWDDGYPSGGNYWSDYRALYPNAVESDSSAVWNESYVIDVNNTDRYPLMGPFNTFGVGTFNGTAYSVDTVSNSSITNLSFSAATKTLSFNVTGANGAAGFCRVTIPLSLMSGEWTVTVNGTQLSPPILNITIYGNYTYFYFPYHHSTETVIIQSTTAIPEFQSFMLLPLLMMITLLTATVSKRKRNAKK